VLDFFTGLLTCARIVRSTLAGETPKLLGKPREYPVKPLPGLQLCEQALPVGAPFLEAFSIGEPCVIHREYRPRLVLGSRRDLDLPRAREREPVDRALLGLRVPHIVDRVAEVGFGGAEARDPLGERRVATERQRTAGAHPEVAGRRLPGDAQAG